MVRNNTVVEGRSRKRYVRRGAALIVGAGLLAAFSGLAPAAVASAKVVPLGGQRRLPATSLVIGDTSSVQKLDPDVVTNFLDFQALGLIYDQLVQYNSKLQLVPDLATSWAYSNDNKLLTFQLRKRVTFDDGTPFTSANVVASMERALAPKTGDASASFLANVEKIKATGTYTVEFILSRPDTSILDGLTSVNISILSTKAIAERTRWPRHPTVPVRTSS